MRSRRARASGVLTAAPTPRAPARVTAACSAGARGAAVRTRRCGLLDCRAHSWTHPEGWRDWPYETPATTARHSGKVPIPDRCVARPSRLFATPVTRRQSQAKESSMAVESSAVQGVQGASTRSRRCTCASAASGRWRSPTTTAARRATSASCAAASRAGPQNIWRYADFLPLAGGPPGPSGRLASRVGLPAGCTPLIRADRLAEQPRPARGVGQERRRQPDALVQGPRRLGRRRAGARARLRDDRLRLDRQPRQLGGRARRGARAGLLRVHPGRPRGAEGPRHGRLRRPSSSACEGNYDDVNRLCTELCAERDWAFVNINLRPYYAEGSKTLAFEIAEQLGWELPDRCVVPIASGSLFTKIATRLRGVDRARAARGRRCRA